MSSLAHRWTCCAVTLLLGCSVKVFALSDAAPSGPLTAAVEALTQPEPSAQRQRAWRRLQLASVYFEQGHPDVAMQEVRAALRIDPQDAQAFNLLGLIHHQRHADDLAEQSFQQALKLAHRDPASRDTLASVAHNYGWFLCERGQFAQGQHLLTQALTLPVAPAVSGHTFKTWLVLGDCQQQAGQTTQARHSWRQALTLEPHNPWLQKRLSAVAADSLSVE